MRRRPSTASRRPSPAVGERLDEGARLLLGGVDLRSCSELVRLRPARARSRRPGTPLTWPPNTWLARRMASTRLTSSSPVGRLAQDVQPVADLHVLDLAQPAVDVHHELVEHLVVGPVVQPEVVVQLGGLDQGPDLAAQRRHLGRVHRRDVAVLVEQLLQPGDVAVRLGPRHRRHQVVDDRRVRAALGLRALAGVVDQEGVDQRHRADAPRRCRSEADMPRFLPGSHSRLPCLPTCTTACAPNSRSQPAVDGQVVVGRGKVRVVVDRDRVLAEAARRLDQDDDVPGLQGRGDDLAVGGAACGRRTARPAPRPRPR